MTYGAESGTTTHRSLAAALFLAGAVLLLLGNLVHPVDASPTSTSRLELAGDWIWMPVHIALAVAILLLVGATAVLERAFVGPRKRALARFATVTAVIGGGLLATVFGALDGYAVSALATHAHATGVEIGTIEAAALALEAVDSGMAALGALSFLGLTLLALAGALLPSGIVPRAIGWMGAAVGLGGTATGVALLAVGMTPLTLNLMFRPVAMAATLYFLVLGVALLRRRPAGEATPASGRVAPRRP